VGGQLYLAYIANTPLQMDHVINPKLFVYHLLLSL